MKPILKENDPYHYVSENEMVKFIRENSDMEHNDVCDYVRKHGITGGEGHTLWDASDFDNPREVKLYYNEHQVKWVKGFFEAHPWIKKMMLVFDD